MVPFDSLFSYSHSVVTMAVSCIITEIKRDIGRKSRFFSYPLHSTLVGGSSSVYCHTVWYGNNRMAWLPDVKKFDDMFRRFSRRVTDKQTDVYTARHLATA